MSRQLDIEAEERTKARKIAAAEALDYHLAGVIEFQGGELRGLAIKYDAYMPLLTLKASFEGKWFVTHISSDTMANCILSAVNAGRHNALKWVRDKYQPSDI